MQIFDINNVAFEILNYPISYVELIATLFGLVSVYLATRANIFTWATGIVNEFFLFILFFQVQLYADMFLQIYFFVVTIFGWYHWKKTEEEEKSISTISLKEKTWIASIIVMGTLITGYFFSNIHCYLPQYFEVKANYPYIDSLVMVLSIIATILLARKKLETWYLWIIVDVICVFLFFKKEIVFLGLEYIIFLGLVIYGLLNWKKQLSND
jgi:nicotinamide mononucleotide transporter